MIQLHTRTGKVIGVALTPAILDQLHQLGELPIDLVGALTLDQAAGIALLLPMARGEGDPIGYGVAPPRGAEPLVRVRAKATDAHGRRVDGGSRGALGCLWRSRSDTSPVHRVFFTAEPGQGPRIVDVYDRQIASVESMADTLPAVTGWQIIRLDV